MKGAVMSVIVIGRFKTDPADMQKVFTSHGAELKAISEDAKTQGCLHHQFAAGDGEILLADEWTTAEAFQQFFGNQTTIPEIMKAANVQAPPEFQIYEGLDSPDRF
jgi:hypothetical protein